MRTSTAGSVVLALVLSLASPAAAAWQDRHRDREADATSIQSVGDFLESLLGRTTNNAKNAAPDNRRLGVGSGTHRHRRHARQPIKHNNELPAGERPAPPQPTPEGGGAQEPPRAAAATPVGFDRWDNEFAYHFIAPQVEDPQAAPLVVAAAPPPVAEENIWVVLAGFAVAGLVALWQRHGPIYR